MKDLNIDELKVKAYDVQNQLVRLQNVLQQINQQIFQLENVPDSKTK